MKYATIRHVTWTLAAGLVIAGCASKPQPKPQPQPIRTTASATTSATVVPATAPAPARTGPVIRTGIASCDDYLDTYVACHRVAGIYPPDQIEPHFVTMRDILVRRSQDPKNRPQLDVRCHSLAAQLHEALHGKSCGATPEPQDSHLSP